MSEQKEKKNHASLSLSWPPGSHSPFAFKAHNVEDHAFWRRWCGKAVEAAVAGQGGKMPLENAGCGTVLSRWDTDGMAIYCPEWRSQEEEYGIADVAKYFQTLYCDCLCWYKEWCRARGHCVLQKWHILYHSSSATRRHALIVEPHATTCRREWRYCGNTILY